MKSYNLSNYARTNSNICKRTLTDCIKRSALERFKRQWSDTINRNESRSGNGGNKLRTYKLFKQDFCTETYVTRAPHADANAHLICHLHVYKELYQKMIKLMQNSIYVCPAQSSHQYKDVLFRVCDKSYINTNFNLND